MRKVALVVAGSVRLGRDVAVALADAGFDVVLTCAKDQGPVRDAVDRIAELGRRVLVIQDDMSDPSAVGEVRIRIDRTFGRLDLLVEATAAGAFLPSGAPTESVLHPVASGATDDPLVVLRAMAPLLRASEGTVVTLPDPSVFGPWVDPADHAASTSGLGAFTRLLARAMAPHVRVNAIAPAGAPSDLVRTILFLAGSPFVTGEVITIGEDVDPEP